MPRRSTLQGPPLRSGLLQDDRGGVQLRSGLLQDDRLLLLFFEAGVDGFAIGYQLEGGGVEIFAAVAQGGYGAVEPGSAKYFKIDIGEDDHLGVLIGYGGDSVS